MQHYIVKTVRMICDDCIFLLGCKGTPKIFLPETSNIHLMA
jgi:hypothetical protein